MSNYSLANSIRICKQLTRQSGSSFVPAFALLPSAKREAMEIFYAYNRFTDDLVDQPDFDPKTGRPIETNVRRKRQKLNQWVGALEAALGTLGTDDVGIADPNDETAFRNLEQRFPGCEGLELLPALKMIIGKFNIPREPLFHLIDGVDSDIEPRRFETFDDCADYCHQVATSVGFASLAIWGTEKPLFSDPVVHAAKACGIAFQWTNILRDLLEDYHDGRIYLPQSELQRFGLTEKQFGSLLDRKSWDEQKQKPKDLSSFDHYAHEDMIQQMKNFEEKFDKLLAHQFGRCEIYFSNATPLFHLIRPDCRKVFGMMWSRYYALFQKMRSKPLRITKGRTALSSLQKLRLFLRWKFLPAWRLRETAHAQI